MPIMLLSVCANGLVFISRFSPFVICMRVLIAIDCRPNFIIMTSYMKVWKGTADLESTGPDSDSKSIQTFSYMTVSMSSKILLGTMAM